jgi:hypothetical protein
MTLLQEFLSIAAITAAALVILSFIEPSIRRKIW